MKVSRIDLYPKSDCVLLLDFMIALMTDLGSLEVMAAGMMFWSGLSGGPNMTVTERSSASPSCPAGVLPVFSKGEDPPAVMEPLSRRFLLFMGRDGSALKIDRPSVPTIGPTVNALESVAFCVPLLLEKRLREPLGRAEAALPLMAAECALLWRVVLRGSGHGEAAMMVWLGGGARLRRKGRKQAKMEGLNAWPGWVTAVWRRAYGQARLPTAATRQEPDAAGGRLRVST